MNMLIRFFILMRLLKQQGNSPDSNNSHDNEQGLNEPLYQELLFKPFSRRYRVLPHDMGFRKHLPNYRYLSFIELNITGWLLTVSRQNQLRHQNQSTQQTGDLPLNWIISMQEMVYLKEIKFLDKMTVTSTLEGWDNKYIYFQHHFYVKNTLMAIGLTKFVLESEQGLHRPEILDMQGKHLTNVIDTWNANQLAIKQQ